MSILTDDGRMRKVPQDALTRLNELSGLIGLIG